MSIFDDADDEHRADHIAIAPTVNDFDYECVCVYARGVRARNEPTRKYIKRSVFPRVRPAIYAILPVIRTHSPTSIRSLAFFLRRNVSLNIFSTIIKKSDLCAAQ